VPRNFEIGLDTVIERLPEIAACAVPAFLGEAQHYLGQRSNRFN
jgi:hypothetical protein